VAVGPQKPEGESGGPIFVLLGHGIGVSLIFMRQHRPWTPDRWFAVDLLVAYVTIQYADPPEDRAGTPEFSMKSKAASCMAYHIHKNGKVDSELAAKIRKILKDYSISQKSYKASVISNVEYAKRAFSEDSRSNPNNAMQRNTVNGWRTSCDALELYGDL
jgi:hypothetical protein